MKELTQSELKAIEETVVSKIVKPSPEAQGVQELLDVIVRTSVQAAIAAVIEYERISGSR